MLFTTDKQTLDDLHIFGQQGSDSIYTIFNRTSTRGGAAILEELFNYPLSDEIAINRRSGIIQYFATLGVAFPFSTADLATVEPYLDTTDERTKLSAQEYSVGKKISNLIAIDAATAAIYKGVVTVVDLLKNLHDFLIILKLNEGDFYRQDVATMLQLLAEPAFEPILNLPAKSKLSNTAIVEYDVLFRFRHRDVLLKLLRHIHYMDVYFAVAKVAQERQFIFPKALAKDQHAVLLEGLYHPQVKHAISNSIHISPGSNVVFLTGANMAGKSTFMKSLSIALYLAHMGFPVAATKMEFSVLDGIYTTINLPDNLGMGASHFYAEVLRVKKIARELAQNKNLFILFDELFRGTNVKDACEATIACTAAFAQKRNSLFVISTHIIEAGEVLKKQYDNINFVYLPTRMQGTNPVYTYTLEQGITADRHGMIIINNEGILDILKTGGSTKQQAKGFIADQQTLSDLNLLGKYKPDSIFSLFNQVHTGGGERLLQEMFHNPLQDAAQINERSTLFKYFQEKKLHFPFDTETFAQVENYLSMGTAGSFPVALAGMLQKKLWGSFLHDEQFKVIYSGLIATIEMLNTFRDFLVQLKNSSGKATDSSFRNPYATELEFLINIFADPRLDGLKQEQPVSELSVFKVAKYDYLLKHTLSDQLEQVMESIYRLDIYMAVTKVSALRGFSYAEAEDKGGNLLHTSAVWHPALIKGIANPLSLNHENNMFFLTGANMAGKSTFMKSFGIAVYLAHMGFPVAAKEMKFSVRDGLYSSINVPDNLDMGYSHFYAEVLRVKKVAEEVSAGKDLVVVCDELFKGTNVKDAFDATLSVTQSFSRYRNCFFMISTHIIEVGERLRETTENIRFFYLPTVIENNIPKYTYQLKEGITGDRQGMMIIENEGIMELLKNKSATTS